MSEKNRYDLHGERLSSTDEQGKRNFIYPQIVKGNWYALRTKVYHFLVLILLVLPWITIDGSQSILLDITNHHYVFFGTEFFAHDTPYLIFFFLGFAFLVGAVTGVFGRVWCGWTCPQTVFIEGIYRYIEVFFEGQAIRRRKRDNGPWTMDKLWRKTAKWFFYTIVSLHITHSILGYFVGTHELFLITTQNPAENWELFLAMIFISLVFLFDFGWFRDQFCIIMCPYGRMQSVLMDSDSLVVAYDQSRGEPRKRTEGPGDHGDCVNCYQCVKVCPTGIDIRRGTQMECIACTACIDACDEIMDKVKSPRGLIRYTTENQLAGKSTQGLSLRSKVYLVILTIVLIVSSYMLMESGNLKANIFRAGNTPFTLIKRKKEGTDLIMNHYKLDLVQSVYDELNVKVSIDPKNNHSGILLTTSSRKIILKKNVRKIIHLFVKFPQSYLTNGKANIKINVNPVLSELKDQISIQKEVPLVGPFR
jgi:cytochrome c oxidase accessory protein FixG